VNILDKYKKANNDIEFGQFTDYKHIQTHRREAALIEAIEILWDNIDTDGEHWGETEDGKLKQALKEGLI